MSGISPNDDGDAASDRSPAGDVVGGDAVGGGVTGFDRFFDDLASKYDLISTDPTVPDSESGLIGDLAATGSVARYVQGDLLGRGGMGVVYQAWDRDLRRPVAMKTLAPRSGPESSGGPAPTSDLDPTEEATTEEPERTEPHPSPVAKTHPQLVGRFLEEAQIAGQLEHPGIVPVHELGVDAEGRLFFTMSLVEGHELREILKWRREGRKEWSLTRILGALSRAAEALAYAHSRGVIHRDLKPSNIMVGQFGETYVMDWGLAKVLGRKEDEDDAAEESDASTSSRRVSTSRSDFLTESNADREDRDGSSEIALTVEGAVVGTPLYMAPEQAGTGEPIGAWTDVYSIGIILYEILAGESPFIGDDLRPRAVIDRVRRGDYRPLESRASVPSELVAICERAMAHRPEDRYPSLQELAADLSAYLEHRVVRAYRTGAWAEFTKWIRRNRATAAAVLIGLGLTLTAFGALYWSESKRSDTLEREADLHWVMGAETVADELWPAHPETLPQIDAWLERAEVVLAREDRYRQARDAIELLAPPYTADDRKRDRETHPEAERLARLKQSLPAGPPAEDPDEKLRVLRDAIADIESRVYRRQNWDLAPDEAREHATLDPLVIGIAKLRSSGLVESVRKRRAFATTVADRTVTGKEAREAWGEATAAIAADPTYAGLSLSPQIGLLPLGRNPRTGLWEFWHLQSGERPQFDGDGSKETGRYALREETGMVFILVPGGTFTMGADEDDDGAFMEEQGRHEVTLEPFFFSAFEVTQGQWLRLEGRNPSFFYPRPDRNRSFLHPVESIIWDEVHDAFGRLGLDLPTEAQWEYTARAGLRFRYGIGNESKALHGYANLGDLAATRYGFNYKGGDADWTSFDDGHGHHAPVGHFRPNPWGFHDLHGNVAEWCRDFYVSNYLRFGIAVGTGERLVPLTYKRRVIRGGSFFTGPHVARVTNRVASLSKSAAYHRGCRPVRRIRK